MADPQIELRDTFLRTAFAAVDLGDPKTAVETAVSAAGAVAVFIALLPPTSINGVVEQICEALPRMVELRRREILSGAFDRQMDRQQ